MPSNVKLRLIKGTVTIPDKIFGTTSKFSPPPTNNVDNLVIFTLFVEKQNVTFSNIDILD